MSTTIYLIRHGETDWNRDSIFRGRVDVPLNNNGLKQAEAAGKGLDDVEFDAVYSSPLSRALQTAEAVAATCGLEVNMNEDFSDIDYGKWQGMTLSEVKANYPKEYKRWQSEPHKAAIPDGERLSEIHDRAWGALREVVRSHPDQTIAVAAHRVINKVLVLGALGLPLKDFWRIRQDNCSVNVFEFTDKEVIIHCINDTCHLKDVDLISADF